LEDLSRRALLTGVCGVAVATVTALPSDAASAVRKLSDGRLSIRVRDISALKEVGSSVRVGVLKGQPVALARTGPSDFVAFTLICPHQEFRVVKDGAGWLCKAHGSKFESNGDLNFGPATTGLPQVPAKFSRGQVIIG
jgi:Rieske Fe-S protein